MSGENQELFEKVQIHLQKLNSSEVESLDERLVDNLISLVTIDKAVHENKASIKSLLALIAQMLHNTHLDIDFNKIIELLDGLLSNLDFESVVDLLKFESIIQALNSPNENLQILALKVSSKANPPDIVSNTEVIPRAIDLLARKESSIKVVNEVEKTLSVLIRGDLIRRRLLNGNVASVLLSMKSSKDTTLKTRLMDLIIQVLPRVNELEIPEKLYSFTDFSSDDDILYTLNLIRFYTGILEIVETSLDKNWLLQKILPQANLIGKLYLDRYENPEIEYFASTEIALFFKNFSYVSPELFKYIDEKYIRLSSNDKFLLSSLNPAYLATSHTTLLRNLTFSVPIIPIVRNLISDEDSFNLIKLKLTTEKLQRLPYLELVAVLARLSEFRHSARYLLQELPQIMNKLLQGDTVIEPESNNLRKITIENLIQFPAEDLNVWKEALEGEHYKLTHGKPMKIQTLIHDGTL